MFCKMINFILKKLKAFIIVGNSIQLDQSIFEIDSENFFKLLTVYDLPALDFIFSKGSPTFETCIMGRWSLISWVIIALFMNALVKLHHM